MQDRSTRWTGLECPKCGCKRLDVYYTRQRASCQIRVRICALCGKRIPTVETVVGGSPKIEPKIPVEREKAPVERPKLPKTAKKKFHGQNKRAKSGLANWGVNT